MDTPGPSPSNVPEQLPKAALRSLLPPANLETECEPRNRKTRPGVSSFDTALKGGPLYRP